MVDIVYICGILKFNWENIVNDASEKELWANPVNIVEVLEQFQAEKLQGINWLTESPSNEWFNSRINQIIPDILEGNENSLF